MIVCCELHTNIRIHSSRLLFIPPLPTLLILGTPPGCEPIFALRFCVSAMWDVLPDPVSPVHDPPPAYLGVLLPHVVHVLHVHVPSDFI